jgi:hypothetical protein
MKGILRSVGFVAFMAAMLWCATGCSWMVWDDDQTFDEMAVIEFEVTEATLRPISSKKPFPYGLNFYMAQVTGDGGQYKFYSDEKCTKQLLGDELVTVNGKPPSGLKRMISAGGGCVFGFSS